MERTQKVRDGGSKDESEETGGKVSCNRGLHDLATHGNLLSAVIKSRKCRVRHRTKKVLLLFNATLKHGAKTLHQQRSARY